MCSITPLLPSKFKKIDQSMQVITTFHKYARQRRKKIMKKNTRQTLKVCISVMDGWIHLKFGMGGVPLEGVSTTKMVNFCLAIIELRMLENGIFLVPVKYTLVCHMPDDTLSCVLTCLAVNVIIMINQYNCKLLNKCTCS